MTRAAAIAICAFAALLAVAAGCATILPALGGAAAGVTAAVIGTPAPACKPPPAAHWQVCRDACAKQGGAAAAVIGPVDPAQQPQCQCAKGDGT